MPFNRTEDPISEFKAAFILKLVLNFIIAVSTLKKRGLIREHNYIEEKDIAKVLFLVLKIVTVKSDLKANSHRA